MKAPRTPLPWTVDCWTDAKEVTHYWLVGQSHESLTDPTDDRRYMQHAANLYPELVAALRMVTDVPDVTVSGYTSKQHRQYKDWLGAVVDAKALLAKCEEE